MSTMFLNKRMIICLLISVVMIGCGKQQKTTPKRLVKVKTMEAEKVNYNECLRYVGTVEGKYISRLSFPVAGKVMKLYKSNGEKVNKGQLLAFVDDQNLKNLHAVAKASLEQAEDALKRLTILYDKKSLPEIEYVNAKTKFKQAEAAEALAKKKLKDAYLYAPFSGYIGTHYVEIGENVLPNSPVYSLTAIGKVKIKIAIPEKEYSKIKKGMKAKVTIPALDNKVVEAVVEEKSVIADLVAHTYGVKLLVDNLAGEIIPGMVCNATVFTEKEQTAFDIPVEAVLLSEKNHYFVWCVVNNQSKKRKVTIGQWTAKGVQVLEGLKDGDEVIVEGMKLVCEGTEVTTIK